MLPDESASTPANADASPRRSHRASGFSAIGKFDGPSVRRVSVGFGPGLFAREQRGRIGQPLGGHQTLERRQPVFVVARAVVGFAAIGGGLEFVREAAAHSFQVKCPCSESLTASANACACHGSANTGPPSSRGRRGRADSCSELGSGSGSLEVVVPQIEVHRVARRRLLAPQLARREAHRVDVLRFLAVEVRVGVGEEKTP